MARHAQCVFRARVTVMTLVINSGSVVALVEHATKGKKHAEKVALRRYLHSIKLKIMLNVYELLFSILMTKRSLKVGSQHTKVAQLAQPALLLSFCPPLYSKVDWLVLFTECLDLSIY